MGRRPAQLVSTYFDTADHALWQRGLTLRVRQRDGRFVQTVKSDTEIGGMGVNRGEWEDEIAGPVPDPQAAQSGRFIDLQQVSGLVPLFRTEIGRRTIHLARGPDTRIEAAIDRGRIYAPSRDASEPVSEVELELKSGAAAALYDIALDLLAVAPVRLERRSKSERGYRLANGEPAPVAAGHATPVDLDAAMDGDAALRRIGIACLDQILRNEAAVLAGLPEGIHQMRVAVRRLRAVLSAFGKMLPADQRDPASQELRWLADALGEARNLDVFETGLLGPARSALDGETMVGVLTAAAEQRRGVAYERAKRAVRSTRYTALLLRLLRWFESCGWRYSTRSGDLEQPIGTLAVEILDRCVRTVKRRSRGFAGQTAQQRHRLRIALKKLRYASEVLAALYREAEVERFISRLKRLQDDLGEANDVRVGRDIVAELAKANGNAGAIADAGNSVLDWHEHRLAGRQRKLRKHLDRLLAAAPFWAA
jgi:triphosphatase